MDMMLELLIWGDKTSIDRIVNEINIKPVEVIHQGDIVYVGPKKNIQQIQKDNIVIYSTGYLETRDVKVPIQKMLDAWKIEKTKIKKICKKSKDSYKIMFDYKYFGKSNIVFFS